MNLRVNEIVDTEEFQPIKTVIKRFKSKRQVLTQEVIYVYCPKDRELEIGEIVDDYSFDMVVNDYSITDLSCKVICHFESARLTKEQRQFLVKATELGAWVEPLVSYLDERLGYTEVRLLHSGYFLHQKAFSILSTKRTQLAKRVIDLFAAFLLCSIAIPIGLITALAIKLESPGPVFYKQRRTGQYNDEFEVIKFRSMRSDAEKAGAQWAAQNDVRVTKVGNFIRKTRIDELPQIINILKGEMSIVGPRPEREVFIAELEKEIPYYRFRHAVKPGVTGLAQVSYPYGASVEDAIWKHKYDIYYIKHHSTLLDIKILLKTVKVVLFGMGR
ncbi:exopolysaccharide biosynthesis polyprenyl glycosylphosphotransferase [Shewanella oncorhynchi]|uniref:Exopolysaccharide biosynthesis polyprenyl glycosylphosphotransferase n=1 Tax=Shewanella oncorhynchi TaxID=2726434 RepID=A0AA50KGH7_9GAMM|nr:MULTISPECIES: exopolysaccharide biosynthesis polyprenyl glycosylphosphotransferase [Shewanella]MCU8055560.1 exopolysaccharide biosynthesis polyprenyl glycosylphosphotransferase [Shewanella sp. SM35]MCU8064482.1 exopolysaccharide biosynthesis polyprenyl glycosylphosphotransferase [Shewanella sp. SM34]WMB74448.1 exopolysaccharide biosynthesis polyprenyl glycosylphosphotransferase [Shewanella oncorhynchi]